MPDDRNKYWTSILKVSCLYDIPPLQRQATTALNKIASPVDRIVMQIAYGVKWNSNPYVDLCRREDPLTIEEGIQVGVEESVRIAAAREAIRPGINVAEGDILKLLNQHFGEDKVPAPKNTKAKVPAPTNAKEKEREAPFKRKTLWMSDEEEIPERVGQETGMLLRLTDRGRTLT